MHMAIYVASLVTMAPVATGICVLCTSHTGCYVYTWDIDQLPYKVKTFKTHKLAVTAINQACSLISHC